MSMMSKCTTCGAKGSGRPGAILLCGCRNRYAAPAAPVQVEDVPRPMLYPRLPEPEEIERPDWQQLRHETCRGCEHYQGLRRERCGVLVAKGRGGYLWHSKGIPRADTECPLQKWGRWKPLEDNGFPHASACPPDADSQPIVPRSPRLVITIATGDACGDLLKLTGPLMRDYAQRCGADFVALRHPQFAQWQRDKFRVGAFAAVYTQTLFIDADCIITPRLPDLFQEVPLDAVGIHDDREHLPSTHWLTSERRLVSRGQGVDVPDYPTCWNTGLVMLPQSAAGVWSQPPGRLPSSHCSEQIWIEHLIHQQGHPVHLFPTSYNTQFWMKDYSERCAAAAVIHLANSRRKIEDAKHAINHYCNHPADGQQSANVQPGPPS